MTASESASPSPTEDVNPVSVGIDRKSSREIVELMHGDDLEAWRAVGEARESIAALIDSVVDAFRVGGRLVYVGAGTSGRLGVLDASECPPTFGVEPELVVGIIAGGDVALRSAVEGAEDSAEDGAASVATNDVSARDVVCGIAASGSTPFVRGALLEASGRGATTALITSNARLHDPQLVASLRHLVTLPTGPEIVAGSTRLKSGTATKMTLNLVTTGAMIRWGKVYDNLMVDLRATNRKLRRRARGLVERIAAVSAQRASELLDGAGGDVKTAIVMELRGLGRDEAERALESAGGRLRDALEAG